MAITFGNKLRELRLENELTQKELAVQLATTVSTLSHWECNYQEPSLKDLLKISSLFNVTVDYLLGIEDEFDNKSYQIPPKKIKEKLTPEEQQVLADFRILNASGKKLIRETIKTLLTSSAGSGQNRNKIS